MPTEPAAVFRRYRAPQEDGQTLIDPARSALPDVVARNQQRLAAVSYDFHGRSLTDLSSSARCHLIQDAVAYTSQYRDAPQSISDFGFRISDSRGNPPSAIRNPQLCPPVILSGHQPQLFHPGVWYKNFVLGSLARQVGGIGIHFLIDSDLCRSVAIRVPTGTPAQPRVETVPFDSPGPEIPYEERTIRDYAVFNSFASRVTSLIQPLVTGPLIDAYWPLVKQQRSGENNLGRRLAQGRHLLEASWQNDTLELPQSAVCQLPEFAWFVAHLLAHLPRFRAAHNEALAEYRRAHRLRNRAQPVPDLGCSDGWCEAPLWIWTANDPERRPLFVRQHAGQIEISDRRERTIGLVLSSDGDPTMAVEQLLGLADRGTKIRTRALATTLFARLVLGDLFLHGIGGAKYDQVTNQIARTFFGFDLPEFATVSATLRLPIDRSQAAPSDSASQRQLRELRYHPEQFVNGDDSLSAAEVSRVRDIIADKRRWIETAKSPANARDRHRAITAANDALQSYVAHIRLQMEQQDAVREGSRRAAAILDSREYAFCLYPRRHFERLLLDDLAPSP